MKFTKDLIDKVVDSLRYRINMNEKLVTGVYSFFKTINQFNIVKEDGDFLHYVTAHDGSMHFLQEYQIFDVIKDVILPGKITVLSDFRAVEARSCMYYCDNVPNMDKYDIMTPVEFKSLQLGLFSRLRVAPDSFVGVDTLKAKCSSVSDVEARLAVGDGYDTVLGRVLEYTGVRKGHIYCEPAIVPTIPIVVSSYYKKNECYNYNAEDVVVEYFQAAFMSSIVANKN